jgi:hypothetical protein
MGAFPIGATIAFGEHVLHVVAMRTDKQVVDVGASLNITAVEDMQSLWDGAINLLPDYAMQKPFLAVRLEKPAIATRNHSSFP